MAEPHVEVLMNIDEIELEYFSEFYREHRQLCYASSCLMNGVRIKQLIKGFPIRFLSPAGAWRINGTFFSIVEIGSSYEVGVFAAFLRSDSAHESISAGLELTRRINFESPNRYVVFKHIHHSFHYILRSFLDSRQLEIQHDEQFHIMKIKREVAMKFDIQIPDDIKLGALEARNVPQIYASWPHFYPPTQEYIGTLIWINGGYGFFSKKDGELLSWGIKTMSGTIGFVQTVEKAKRKGYATMIVKLLAKELGYENQHPVAMVGIKDPVAHVFFESVGFQIVGLSHNVHLKPKKDVTQNVDKGKKLKRTFSMKLKRRKLGSPSKKDLLEAGPSRQPTAASSSSAKPTGSGVPRPKDLPIQSSEASTSTAEPSTSSGSVFKSGLKKMKRFSMNLLTGNLSGLRLFSAAPPIPSPSAAQTRRSQRTPSRRSRAGLRRSTSSLSPRTSPRNRRDSSADSSSNPSAINLRNIELESIDLSKTPEPPQREDDSSM